MFGIKKRGRALSKKAHSMMAQKSLPFFQKVAVKLRLSARMKLLNRWGRNHPKKMVAYYIMFAFCILAINFIFPLVHTSSRQNKSDPLELNKVAKNDFVNGMQHINLNRELIQDAVTELNNSRLDIANHLDSLCNLPVKTLEDSIQISYLWNILNKPTDKTHEPKTN